MPKILLSLMTILSFSFGSPTSAAAFMPTAFIPTASTAPSAPPVPSAPPAPPASPSHPKVFLPFPELSHHESLNHFSEKANHMTEHMTQEMGKNIVLSVSSNLPKFDSVGHKILSANHDFIEKILHNEVLSHQMKKDIILASIKLSQMGDDMGSHILQQYYNLVERCL